MNGIGAPHVALFLAVLLGVHARSATAHGIEYSVETTHDGRVRIGGFYSDVGPMVGAAVTVSNDKGEDVHRGRTDANGFAHVPASPGRFTFVLDDGTGHRIEERFEVHAYQLDGRVRDLVAEMGRPATVFERIRALPRWTTVPAGLALIVAIFAALRWVRGRRPATDTA